MSEYESNYTGPEVDRAVGYSLKLPFHSLTSEDQNKILQVSSDGNIILGTPKVSLSGDEEISGIKTFNSRPKININSNPDKNYIMINGDITVNPTLSGTETNLTSIGINGSNYNIKQIEFIDDTATTNSIFNILNNDRMPVFKEGNTYYYYYGFSIAGGHCFCSISGSVLTYKELFYFTQPETWNTRNVYLQTKDVNFATATRNSEVVREGRISYFTIGNIVIVYIQGLRLQSGVASHNALIASGLPKADLTSAFNNEIVYPLNDCNILNSGRTSLRVRISNDSNEAKMYTHYTTSANYSGESQEVYGTIIYQKAVD